MPIIICKISSLKDSDIEILVVIGVRTHVGKLIFIFLVSTKLPWTAQDRHALLAFHIQWNDKKAACQPIL